MAGTKFKPRVHELTPLFFSAAFWITGHNILAMNVISFVRILSFVLIPFFFINFK